jgi:hypothetical protein
VPRASRIARSIRTEGRNRGAPGCRRPTTGSYWPAAIFSWLLAIAGLSTLVAPMVMNDGVRPSRGNDIIVGIIVLALGVANAVYRQDLVRVRA